MRLRSGRRELVRTARDLGQPDQEPWCSSRPTRRTGISGAGQAVAFAIFAVVGTVAVAIPVGIYLAGGPKSEKRLARLKDWMAEHNAVIVSVLCLIIIGVKLIGDAIAALADPRAGTLAGPCHPRRMTSPHAEWETIRVAARSRE